MAFDTSKPVVEQITFIHGVDVAKVSEDDIFALIRQIKKNKATLEETGVESKKLKEKLAKMDADIAALVAVVDSK